MPFEPTESAALPTRAVHAGEVEDAAFGARVPPVYLTAGYRFATFAEARARFAGKSAGYTYSRSGNPTVAALERRVADLEGGTDAVAVGSGHAAIAVALLSLAGAGEHVLAAPGIYSGTRSLFLDAFRRFGIEVEFVADARDPEAWRRRIRPETRALFGETIGNPLNEVLDIEAVAAVAHAAGVPLVVDNTLATPVLLRPAEHGADVIVHSASKFLAGHGTVLGGVLVDAGRFDWAADGRFPHLVGADPWRRSLPRANAFATYARSVTGALLGPALSPANAFLVQQGIETLPLRVHHQSATARALARTLEAHPAVTAVHFAGSAANPDHAVARRLLRGGFGAVFAVELDGGEPAAEAFLDALRLVTQMTHLGDVRTLAVHPATTTHAHLTDEERRALGITPGLVRFSVGLEDPADLIADLDAALGAIPVTADAFDRAIA